jgi:UDP-N-acetylglucosamine--N-acetylmuramyl-(pentapeptide) pyrophosphoryl-undecaprenol N-acetylglucosamine transferase
MKILLTGGGTAGHVMPFVALAPYLTKRFDEIVYVGSECGMERGIVSSLSIPYYSTPTVKYDRGRPLSLLTIPFSLHQAKSKAISLLKTLRPDLIFSKGGYVALPTTLAAHTLGIPIAIHESDYSMGLANKLSSRYADLILTNFPHTHPRGEVVGIPLRDSIFSHNLPTNHYRIDKNLPTILVTGGSSGAKSLNDCILQSLDRLLPRYNLIHLTGGKCPHLVRDRYIPISYTDDIGSLFRLSDLVVSRAGANTATELLALGKKVLFVPLSSGRGDQIENAKYYQDAGYSLTLKDEDMNVDSIVEKIEALSHFSPKPYPYDRDTPRRIVEILYNLTVSQNK